MKSHTKALLVETKANEQGEEVFWFQASVETKDRDGEIVTKDGWEFDNYLKNPVFMTFHDYKRLPVGKTVALVPNDQGFLIGVVFDDEDPEAIKVKSKYQRGFLNAVSVGFHRKETTGKRAGKDWVTTKKELLEVSAAPVPAHPDALLIRKEFEDGGGKAADFQTQLAVGDIRSQLWDRRWRISDALDASNRAAIEDANLSREGKLAAIGVNFEQYTQAMLGWYGDYLTLHEAEVAAGIKSVNLDSADLGEKAGRSLSRKTSDAIKQAIGLLEGVVGSGEKPSDDKDGAKGEDPPADNAGKDTGSNEGASAGAVGAPSDMQGKAIEADLTAFMAFIGNK